MTIRSVSHTFEFQAGELQPPWVYRVFLGRKGVLRVAGCGHATCLDLTLLPSWLWIVNAFREGSRSFSSSAKLAAFQLPQSVFKTKSKMFCVTLADYFPSSIIALLHPLPGHTSQVRLTSRLQRGFWSLPPIPPFNQTQGGGNPKVKQSPQSIYVQFIILKNHLTYIWYLRANFTYLWKKTVSEAMRRFNICKMNTAPEIKPFFS